MCRCCSSLPLCCYESSAHLRCRPRLRKVSIRKGVYVIDVRIFLAFSRATQRAIIRGHKCDEQDKKAKMKLYTWVGVEFWF